jgi:hypothetical protein
VPRFELGILGTGGKHAINLDMPLLHEGVGEGVQITKTIKMYTYYKAIALKTLFYLVKSKFVLGCEDGPIHSPKFCY